ITDTDNPTNSYAVGIKTKSDLIAKERITPNTGVWNLGTITRFQNTNITRKTYINKVTYPASGYKISIKSRITAGVKTKNFCSGANDTLYTAINANSYQWQYFNGTSWVNTNHLQDFSGHNSSKLEFVNLSSSYNNVYFRVVNNATG